ncbi:sugar phosphate isomerase/epimerase [Saccharomonospora piscinae]|uniref:sugar phosphate isomerase/epimerase family protein n=1 Tax=Saccharomonospora piscinae TaxID=687388 RepID=UPI00110755C9|nr:sugar phosphate isomerase/epimerase [Saccharomonospora piscinae]TLW94743.1 sugar phosphate isomerase/epimerase [Saccharomonospora piscinae]
MADNTQKHSRRRVLRGAGTVTAAGIAALWASGTASAGPPARGARPVPPGKIGFGLYSVRDMLAEDPEGTLAMLGEAGYAEIEPAYDYGNRTPAQFRRIADDNGLRVIGSHHHPGDFRGDAAEVTLERAAVLGQKYVGVSYMDGEQSHDGYLRMAEEMNRFGERARAWGLRWYAHLHDHEFHPDPDTGRTLFDVWLHNTDPALVAYELDLYWILAASVEPGPYLRAHESRFPLLHLKDGTPTAGVETDLGDGDVDFASILANLSHPGAHHFVIERDEQPHPVRTANRSYDYLRGLRISPRR